MNVYLEIAQLDDGDVVLRHADDPAAEPVVRIRFSDEVKDRLGAELVKVAEVMITAAAELIENEPQTGDAIIH